MKISLLILFTLSLFYNKVNAESVVVDGINYEIIKNGEGAVVTEGNYAGDIKIPQSISYDGKNIEVISIGKYAFKECTELKSVSLPNTVTSISFGAFQDCCNVKTIEIPNSVSNIDECAFEGCKRLTSINIPSGINSIKSNTFRGCTDFNNITIPQSVEAIEAGAFSYCAGLTSISLPNGLKELEKMAFEGCSSISKVIIPDGIKILNPRIFNKCSKLSSIQFSDEITYIGESAFQGTSIEKINIPSGVYIHWNAFRECVNLKTVIFQGDVTLLERSFAECTYLETVICYSATPPNADEDAFADSYTQFITLYVPRNAIDSYKAKKPWSEFKEILDLTSTSVDNNILSNQVVEIYGIDGGKRGNYKKGINIQRLSNGKTKKVLYK